MCIERNASHGTFLHPKKGTRNEATSKLGYVLEHTHTLPSFILNQPLVVCAQVVSGGGGGGGGEEVDHFGAMCPPR